MLIDTHCHINSLSDDQKRVVTLKACGYLFIDISIDYKSALKSLELSGAYNNIYSSLGFHPLSDEVFDPCIISQYKKLITNSKKAIAIGEVGLDYKAKISPPLQEKILEAFIKLARDCKLALIIHNRWHNDYVFQILNRYFSNYQRVIFHCFSQDKYFLAKILEKNGFVSFSLNILREKPDIIQALKYTPLDSILLETDSPYMRIDGKLSTPLDIQKVYDFVSNKKDLSIDKLSEIIAGNLKKAFGIEIEHIL